MEDPIILDHVIRRTGSGRPRLAALSIVPGPNLFDALVAGCEVACQALLELRPLSKQHLEDLAHIESVLDMAMQKH